MPIPKPNFGSSTNADSGGGTDTGDVQSGVVQTPSRRAIPTHTGPKWRALEDLPDRRYSAVIIQGPDQSGKTDFSFTAPEPILVLSFEPDGNYSGVKKRYGNKNIQVATFDLPKGLVSTPELARIAAAEATRYEELFVQDGCESDYFRTIVMDREDEAWELFRFEEFQGQATSKSKLHSQKMFANLNSAYKGMLKHAIRKKKNLIMLDAVSTKFVDNKPTDEFRREGFRHLGMISQITLEASVDNYDNFAIQVIRCRDDATKNGEIINRKKMEAISQELVETRGAEWPVNKETGEYEWMKMNWENLMAWLIGGKPDEWK